MLAGHVRHTENVIDSNAARSPRRGGVRRYDSMKNQPRPYDRTFSTDSTVVALPLYSTSRPTAGEKMNSRSFCGAFTLPSFGPVLSMFRKCHPSISRGLGTKCHGGVRRDR